MASRYTPPLTCSLSRSNEQDLNNWSGPSQHSTSIDSSQDSSRRGGPHLPPRSRPSCAHYFATATHKELLQHNNQAHGALYDAYNALQGCHDELRVLYDKSLKLTIESGPSSASAPTSTISSTNMKIKREDHPKITYFFQRDYTEFVKLKNKRAGVLDPTLGKKQQGGTRLANSNKNVVMDYIEDEDGLVVNGDTAKNIHSQGLF
ncbi:hypothetical protein BYT27DRAFT_7252431 [Phlegmacium glaucopus]|nr:hypothetical protein BYT27DRAFT_7252431 [Phlegmacium glaucopus]